jgi:hypothetical protein
LADAEFHAVSSDLSLFRYDIVFAVRNLPRAAGGR